MNRDEHYKHLFGDFVSSLEVFRDILGHHGLKEIAVGQFSFDAAKRFGDNLILAEDLAEVHDLVSENADGAISFYQFAHEVEDQQRFDGLTFQSLSTGDHEPFLLLASATRNLMDTKCEEPDED